VKVTDGFAESVGTGGTGGVGIVLLVLLPVPAQKPIARKTVAVKIINNTV
jgi:hypothetical protein